MQERKEINKVAKGTAVAMYVSTMVAAQVTGAKAAFEDAKALVEFKALQNSKNPEEMFDMRSSRSLSFSS